MKYLIISLPNNTDIILNKQHKINIDIIICIKADSSNNVKLSKKSYKICRLKSEINLLPVVYLFIILIIFCSLTSSWLLLAALLVTSTSVG